jgi:hypothetical protein
VGESTPRGSAAATTVQAFDRYDAGLLLGCSVYLYANLFASLDTPFLLGGDQVFFWMGAQRLLHGEQIYRDFFQFNPPGADLLYLSVFKLFGPRIWTPNLVVLALGIVLCLLCLRISRSIMQRSQAALATSLYLVLVIGTTLDGTHHWFSLLLVMAAVAVLVKARSPARIAIAGSLLGLATFFTQTTGPAAALGIAAWMTWERFRTGDLWSRHLRRLALLFAPLVLTWIALSGYYIGTLGLRQLWFFQVTYPREYEVYGWNAMSFGLPEGLTRATLGPLVRWVFAYTVLPAVLALSLWRCWRSSMEAPSDNAVRIGLLTAVGTAMFVEVAQSPSWFRFYCISLPGVILLIWLAGGLGKFSVYAMRLLGIGVIGLAAYQTWSMHVHYSTIEELPAGRIAAAPLAAEKLAWLAGRTKPGQFMLQAGWPGMYLPLALRNPIFLDDLERSGASRLGYVGLSIRQLEAKRVQYIMWSPRLQAPAYSLAEFYHFLVDRYRLVWRFSDQDEIWERKPESAMPGQG